jgi:methylenetetrahydrofolate dehydrogenase (NADP+)/methenyltetrahydrofolate cyclohydrolase
VGKPLAALLLANNATVTIAHSHTKNLKDFTLMADICIAAVGRPNFIDSSFTKNDAAIIDVGINRLSNGIAGDVNFASFENTNCHITPVPGGVGPMTITSLLENTLKAFTNKIQKESVK